MRSSVGLGARLVGLLIERLTCSFGHTSTALQTVEFHFCLPTLTVDKGHPQAFNNPKFLPFAIHDHAHSGFHR